MSEHWKWEGGSWQCEIINQRKHSEFLLLSSSGWLEASRAVRRSRMSGGVHCRLDFVLITSTRPGGSPGRAAGLLPCWLLSSSWGHVGHLNISHSLKQIIETLEILRCWFSCLEFSAWPLRTLALSALGTSVQFWACSGPPDLGDFCSCLASSWSL